MRYPPGRIAEIPGRPWHPTRGRAVAADHAPAAAPAALWTTGDTTQPVSGTLGPWQWARDIARQEQLEALGWIVLRITAQDLYVRPGATAKRVLAALRRRGHPAAPTGISWDFARVLV